MAFPFDVHDDVECSALANDPVPCGLPGQDVEQTRLFAERVEPGLGGVATHKVERLGEDVGRQKIGHRVALGRSPTTTALALSIFVVTAYWHLRNSQSIYHPLDQCHRTE